MYVWTTCRPPPGPPPGSVRSTAVSPPFPRTRSHTLRSFHVWPRRSWHVRTLIRWHFDTIGPLSREGARLHHTSPPCCRARPALRNLTRARHGLHNWAGLEGIGAHNWAADAYERFREAGALCRGRRVRRAPSPSRAARARTAPEPCPACTDVLLDTVCSRIPLPDVFGAHGGLAARGRALRQNHFARRDRGMLPRRAPHELASTPTALPGSPEYRHGLACPFERWLPAAMRYTPRYAPRYAPGYTCVTHVLRYAPCYALTTQLVTRSCQVPIPCLERWRGESAAECSRGVTDSRGRDRAVCLSRHASVAANLRMQRAHAMECVAYALPTLPTLPALPTLRDLEMSGRVCVTCIASVLARVARSV